MPNDVDAMFAGTAPQCPLLKAYLKGAIQRVPEDSYLYSDEKHHLWQIADNAVGNHQCSPKAERLRAFYCVESVYMWLRHLDAFMGLDYSPPDPPPWTWEGLKGLKDKLSGATEGALVHQMALRLKGHKKVSMSYDTVIKGHLPKFLEAVGVLDLMIDELQPALGRDEPKLARVGGLLAQSTADVGAPSLFVKHAHNLVNITEENRISPWQLKELQASFST
jgi:hypothetical protein